MHPMPWTSERYPPAMRNLPPVLRLKAIAIANALLAEGMDDGQAIRIGMARARRWGARRGLWSGPLPARGVTGRDEP